MECEHSQSARMAACSMSCCHEQSASLVSSGLYVLPRPLTIPLPAETLNLTAVVMQEEAVQTIAPPSPPPEETSFQ
jgi:hypothetical protein